MDIYIALMIVLWLASIVITVILGIEIGNVLAMESFVKGYSKGRIDKWTRGECFIEEAVRDIIVHGEYGTGTNRFYNLLREGYSPTDIEEIQKRINERMG